MENVTYIISSILIGYQTKINNKYRWGFLTKTQGMKNLKQLYENYASCIPKFEIFAEIMEQLQKNTALYIDNTNANGEWKDNIYWYKATILQKF